MKTPTLHSPILVPMEREITKATSILEHFIKPTNGLDSKLIPDKILLGARGIAVVTMVKGGFLWSGRLGGGIVVARLADGSWSAPSAIAMVGMGVGGQIGAELTDYVFVLNSDAAVKAFTHKGNLAIGGNASYALGTAGRAVEYDASLVNMAPFYSYSKSKGAYAGVSLEGTVLYTRKDCNRKAYGKSVRTSQIIQGKVPRPPAADPLYRLLSMKFSTLGTSRVGSASPSTDPTEVGRSPTASSSSTAVVASNTPYSPSGPRSPSVKARVVTALYDYTAQGNQDVSFKKGDIITVVTSTASREDWWTGSVGGKTGLFPANYTADS